MNMVQSSWVGHQTPAPLAFEQQTAELTWVGTVNAVLTIATLGIWRFWARAWVRRTIWSSTALFGDRLEYTGTGGELFRGFLKGLVLFLPLVMLSAIAQLAWPEGIASSIASALVSGAVLLMLCYAIYAARRYLASRTTWRGIRFALQGAPSGYMLSQAKWLLLLVPTLGLAYPWLRAAQSQWLIGRLRLGNLRFSFDGRGRELFWPLVASTAINLVLGVLVLLVIGRLAGVMMGSADSDAAIALHIWYWLVAAVPLSLLFGPGRFWFHAYHMRWQAAHTSLGGVRFAMPGATALRVSWLLLSNGLLRVLSLGVLGPLATARTFGFYARHLQAAGMPDLSQAAQAEPGPGTGEGLEALLGGDAFAT